MLAACGIPLTLSSSKGERNAFFNGLLWPSELRVSRMALRWVLLACALPLALYLCRVPLLSGAARWWIVAGPLARADAVVVLGGGVPHRALAAARLYHAGWAPQIVVTDVGVSSPVHPGLLPTEASSSRLVLRAENVPDAAIVAVGHRWGPPLPPP